MRSALAAAVHTLLGDARLVAAPPVVRLAAVLLLAKAPSKTSQVRITYRDLAGWLGCSISHVGHTVVPGLKKAGVVVSTPEREAGYTVAVLLDLQPLKQARQDGVAHPLALLNQRDLATLLRMCEAVSCPGWEPEGKAATPPGFMAVRRGRDAAIDRLTMLLLVLECRTNGRVRMAPGRVAEGYGRADATVARLVGCTVADAVMVVNRLIELGVVEFGHKNRDRLRVVPVTQAHVRARTTTALTLESEAAQAADGEKSSSERPAGPDARSCPRCASCSETGAGDTGLLPLSGDGWAQESFDDILSEEPGSAFREQIPAARESVQVTGSAEASTPEVDGARSHTVHPLEVAPRGFSPVGIRGFSGSADSGCDDQPERTRGSEDQTSAPSQAAEHDETWPSPLRGEKPKHLSSTSRQPGGTAAAFGMTTVPSDLRTVLAPVGLWWRQLERVSTSNWLAKAVRTELQRLKSVVGPEMAAHVLAGRLQRRVEQDSRPIQNLAAWLQHRGLPQRPGCWSSLCDDGIRMDTHGSCSSCDSRIADLRGLRHAVTATVAARYPHLTAEDRRPLYEKELKEAFALQVERTARQFEREAEQRRRLEQRLKEDREHRAEQKAKQAALPCTRCGEPEAGGLCPSCTLEANTRALVEQAVDIVLAVTVDPADAQALAELTTRVEHDTWALVRKTTASSSEQAVAGVCDAYEQYQRARQLLDQRRRRALRALAQSPTADTEAAHVERAAQRDTWPLKEESQADARKAAETARSRVAHDLLAEFLSDLRQCRAQTKEQVRSRSWAERLAELDDRPQAVAMQAGSVG
ncbi:hypothetical protein [Streptomyces sp. YIM 130001]|uniref:hypothetical protein n=1 Tax=Streptomyces sp. YIM 130001 TaxID=2259644 RepID=UPI0013C3F8FA|nr:hypothetical protein [Streptomyces sp. YIM 130001]